jgi:hypothetical protein
MARINVFSAENPGRIDVGQAVGSQATAMYVYDVQPGGSSSPYHYEYEEEWLLVVEARLSCAHLMVSRRSSAATWSASPPVPPERTRS